MNPDQTARLIYLVLLIAVIGGYFLLSQRRNVGRAVRHAALWGLIFVGVIVGYGLWEDLRDTVIPRQMVIEGEGKVEVPLSNDGHYHMILEINGTPVQFVVDTGATEMVLSLADAKRAGIETEGLAFLGIANTANGQVKTARIRLDEVALGDIVDANVGAVVNGGEMEGSLLGMTYLNRFTEVSFGGGQMVLTR